MAYYLNGKLHYYGYYNGQKITIAVPRPALEQLTAPTISLDGDTLTMTATDDRTQEFVIFIDGVEKATVEVPKEETYTVSGTWKFNETISIPSDFAETTLNVNFTSNSNSYDQIYFELKAMHYYGDTYSAIYDVSSGTWTNQAYRTITFDGTQTVSKEFYEWFVANAVQTINFTIRCYNRWDGITQEPQSQTIKAGSTWKEWVDSTNFKILGSPPVIDGLLKITNGGGYELRKGYYGSTSSEAVTADDVIIANGEYEFYSSEPS